MAVLILRRFGLAAAVLIYLTMAVYCSRTLLPSDDEEAYMSLGRLAVTGKISLYQDEMTGQRMALPFYVVGGFQSLFGRNWWAGRLVSVAFGLAALLLAAAAARRLQGEEAGALAGLLIATQGALVGYYTTAGYNAITAALVIAIVYVFLQYEWTWRCAIGMALASLLFLTRTNLFPAIPFFFAWAFLGAQRTSERVLVCVATALPPAVFFLSDRTHLKLLAHVPILQRLVEPLGYRSILEFSATNVPDFGGQLWGLVIFARRYESWTLVLAGVLVALALTRLLRREAGWPALPRGFWMVTALFGWILAWQFVIWRTHWRLVAALFPTFAPLAAVLLAVVVVAMLQRVELPRPARAALVVCLVGALTISVVWIRNPLLPLPRPMPFRGDAVQTVEGAAAELRSLAPPAAFVFVFGSSLPVYLAGLNAPIQHFMSSYGTLAPAGADERVVARNGVWGSADIERWLGRDVDYAVVQPRFMQMFIRFRPEAMARIGELLQDHFTLVGHIGGSSFAAADVYRRRVSSERK